MRTTYPLPLQTLLPGIFDEALPTGPEMINGRDAILRTLPRLAALARYTGQPGLPASMEHFLDSHYVGAKSPHLLVFRTEPGEPITAAVLVHQYRLAGVPLRVFVTEDADGERTVLAPSHLRSRVAVQATDYLMRKRKAHLAIVSLKDGCFAAAQHSSASTVQQWSTTSRTSRRYLMLGAHYNETLASLGAHTRRNLRSAARKAERELGCSFVGDVTISLDEFLALNTRCAYPASEAVARWRHRCSRESAHAVMLGVRTRDGRWLSLLGGRRSHGTLSVDWQMNPKELHAYSPSTVMRSHMIQHEHELGTAQILFEGGTPHTMSESLRADTVTSVVAVSRPSTLRFLQRTIAPRLPEYNVLRKTLEQELHWQTGTLVAGLC